MHFINSIVWFRNLKFDKKRNTEIKNDTASLKMDNVEYYLERNKNS